MKTKLSINRLMILTVLVSFLLFVNLYSFENVIYCQELKTAIKYVDAPNNKSTTIYSDTTLNNLLSEIKQNGYIVFNTQGTSMLPTIKDNSRCSCYPNKDYYIGDIIAFFGNTSEGWQGVLHKIINIDGDTVITQGTNNDFPDIPLKKENILCKVPQEPRYKIIQQIIEEYKDFLIPK